MENTYNIHLGSEVIGMAQVCRRGLYYNICCKCDLSGQVLYKIIADCNGKNTDLGVCVPIDGSFGLRTQIPVKRLGEGELFFRAVPRHKVSVDMFIPVSEAEPFGYLARLGAAYLEKRNGQAGICIQTDSSKPTGQ